MKVILLKQNNSKPFTYKNILTLEQAYFLESKGYYLEFKGNTVIINKEED